jgi:hypothetical protein
MANTYLSRTQTSGNADIFTSSAWVKRTSLGELMVWCVYTGSSNYTKFGIDANNRLKYDDYQGTQYSDFVSNQMLRDVNGWYHLVCAVDTTNSTAGDRVKIYVNGVRVTSWFTQTNYPLNQNTLVNSGNLFDINVQQAGNVTVGGLMSYVAFVDGTQELPTIFGETDSVTGQWKIKTDITPSVAWGTNGFLILKNGNSLTDESTNTNNFTLGGGTLTDTKDCPDNVFATLNPLSSFYYGGTFSNGNCSTVSGASGYYSPITSTLGMTPTSGKYYAEVKFDTASTTIYSFIGITGSPINETNKNIGGRTYGYAYAYNGSKYNNNTGSSYGNGYVEGDIIGIAVDTTNSKIYFSKNGVWQNSGDPTSGSTGTGAAFTISTTPTQGAYFFGCSDDNNGTGTSAWSWNFGNGFFGTSAVADNSTATASTPGTFNYDVPAGYQPLSTKGLNA